MLHQSRSTTTASRWSTQSAAVWNNRVWTLLDGLPTEGSFAEVINDAGVVAGELGDGRVFEWSDGNFTDVGTLGGRAARVHGLSQNGLIVGGSMIEGEREVWHAFLYDGGMHDLGTLPGLPMTFSNGVNSRGEVVGVAYPPAPSGGHPGQSKAFYFDGTGIVALETLTSDWEITEARAINESGQILALGNRPDSRGPRTLLLTPDDAPAGTVR